MRLDADRPHHDIVPVASGEGRAGRPFSGEGRAGRLFPPVGLGAGGEFGVRGAEARRCVDDRLEPDRT